MPVPPKGQGRQQTAEPLLRPSLPKAIPDDVQLVVKNWNPIIEGLSAGLKNFLRSAHLSLAGESLLLIVLDNEVAQAFVNSENHKQELIDQIAKKIGKVVDIRIQQNETNRPFEESFVDIGKMINMELTIEDQEEK